PLSQRRRYSRNCLTKSYRRFPTRAIARSGQGIMFLMTCISARRRTALTLWLIACLALTLTTARASSVSYEFDAGSATVPHLLAPAGEHAAPLALATGIRRSTDGSTS